MTTNIHDQRILILDFGSQYTQLIARRIREIGVYCELWAWDVEEQDIRDFNPNGIILSGGPESVTEAGSPRAPQYVFEAGFLFWVCATACKPCQNSWAVKLQVLPSANSVMRR